MATQIIGSLAINNLLPIQSRAAGSVNFGPLAVPVGYSQFQVMFDLQQVNSLTAQFTAQIDLSFDGGANFVTVGSYGLDLALSGYRLVTGQLLRALDDNYGPGPVRYFGSSIRLTQTDNTTRQIRGTVTCSEALISGVTLVGV